MLEAKPGAIPKYWPSRDLALVFPFHLEELGREQRLDNPRHVNF